ncbi:MAG: UDP-2,3-diacylglucosamine diphosphatase, partial [Pseudomonadota bacterium]
SQLYILGDFFEVWMGDDFVNPFVDQVKAALKALSDTDTEIFLMHGNRDFLLGEDFCRDAGCTLIADPSVIQLGEEKVLLMHGDSLCTEDLEYMKIRQVFRSDAWQKDFLSKSLEERIAFARQVRSESQSGQQMKSADIMDVTQSEVERELTAHNVNIMIHGHTHRPAIHQLDNGKTRYVLGDWSDKNGWEIRWDESSGIDLREFAL